MWILMVITFMLKDLAVLGKPCTLSIFLTLFLRRKKVPQDWCYVYNFDNPNRPVAIPPSAGQGKEFKEAMDKFVKILQRDIRDILIMKILKKKKALIKQEYDLKRSALMEKLNQTSAQYGFQVKSANNGIYMMPVLNSKTIEEEEFEKLDDATKKEFEDKSSIVQQHVMEAISQIKSINQKLTRKSMNGNLMLPFNCKRSY